MPEDESQQVIIAFPKQLLALSFISISVGYIFLSNVKKKNKNHFCSISFHLTKAFLVLSEIFIGSFISFCFMQSRLSFDAAIIRDSSDIFKQSNRLASRLFVLISLSYNLYHLSQSYFCKYNFSSSFNCKKANNAKEKIIKYSKILIKYL